MSKTNKDELRGSDQTLPKYNLHVDPTTGEGFAVDDNGRIVARDAATGLSEATAIAKRTWMNKFKKDNPEGYAMMMKLAQDKVQEQTLPGFYDTSYRPTVSKEEEERLKNNYYYVQALNTAMGSPYNMNLNSFTYNPNIAAQQLQFGTRYPMSTIENAFEMGLGDVAINYGLNYVGQKAIPIIKKIWNSDLRYELDPRYMKVYHHTHNPFDISNFNIATAKDAGLHVSPYPDYNSRLGNVIYKGYARKPTFEFFDRGDNGYNMFTLIDKNHKINLLKNNSPLTERYLRAVYFPQSLKGLKFTPLTDFHIQGIPSKYAKKYKALGLNSHVDNNVDAIDLIFPNESDTFKEDLRKIVNAGIDKNVNTNSKYPLSIDEIDNNNIWVNQQISDFLSSHGYSVGEYPNHNPLEKFPQSFSIFDRSAVRNWTRIRKDGGPLIKKQNNDK